MSAVALKLKDEFRQLVWEWGSAGAINLKLRYMEVQNMSLSDE